MIFQDRDYMVTNGNEVQNSMEPNGNLFSNAQHCCKVAKNIYFCFKDRGVIKTGCMLSLRSLAQKWIKIHFRAVPDLLQKQMQLLFHQLPDCPAPGEGRQEGGGWGAE